MRRLVAAGFSTGVIYKILRQWDVPEEALAALDNLSSKMQPATHTKINLQRSCGSTTVAVAGFPTGFAIASRIFAKRRIVYKLDPIAVPPNAQLAHSLPDPPSRAHLSTPLTGRSARVFPSPGRRWPTPCRAPIHGRSFRPVRQWRAAHPATLFVAGLAPNLHVSDKAEHARRPNTFAPRCACRSSPLIALGRLALRHIAHHVAPHLRAFSSPVITRASGSM